MTFLCLEFLSWLRVVSQDAAADDDDDVVRSLFLWPLGELKMADQGSIGVSKGGTADLLFCQVECK